MNKIKAFTIKITLKSYYANSINTFYYTKLLNSEISEDTADFANNKKDALLILRLFEKFKKVCFDEVNTQIMKTVKTNNKLLFITQYNNFYHSKITLHLIEDEKQADKYWNKAKNTNKLFSDSYLFVSFINNT